MIAQDLRQTLEGIDLRPRFWGLQWSCPSPWEVLGGIHVEYIYLRENHIQRMAMMATARSGGFSKLFICTTWGNPIDGVQMGWNHYMNGNFRFKPRKLGNLSPKVCGLRLKNAHFKWHKKSGFEFQVHHGRTVSSTLSNTSSLVELGCIR